MFLQCTLCMHFKGPQVMASIPPTLALLYMTDYTTFAKFVNIYMSKSFGMNGISLSNWAHNDAQCEFFTALAKLLFGETLKGL